MKTFIDKMDYAVKNWWLSLLVGLLYIIVAIYAQSITNGNGSSVGIAIVNGLVPSMGSTPKVGAMLGLAFVPVKPIMFSRVAIIAQ